MLKEGFFIGIKFMLIFFNGENISNFLLGFFSGEIFDFFNFNIVLYLKENNRDFLFSFLYLDISLSFINLSEVFS